jgi:multiple sugar transport system permease protein
MRDDKWIRNLLLGPALLVLAATVVYPFLSAFVLSFRDWQLNKSLLPGAFVGLKNYERAFQDPHFINCVVVTVEYTIISVVISMVVGLGIALLLCRPGLINLILKSFLVFPFAMSPALKGFSWRFMLNPQYGIINHLIGWIYPPAAGFVWLGHPFWAMFWLAITEVWGWAPYIALVFIGALGTLPQEVFDAAKVDGASTIQTFWHVTLPLLRPIIVMMVLLKTIFSVKQFDAVVTLTGGGPGRATETMNYYVYKTGFSFFDMGYASALAYLLVVAMFIFAFFYVRSLLRREA